MSNTKQLYYATFRDQDGISAYLYIVAASSRVAKRLAEECAQMSDEKHDWKLDSVTLSVGRDRLIY